MNSDCIQIKYKLANGNDQTVKFSGVDANSTSDLTSVLNKINKQIYTNNITKLNQVVSNNNDLQILDESDYTRIADYKTGNVSVFTLQSILQNRGSVLSSELNRIANILHVSGINIKSGNILITNTKSPQLYVGEYRNLLELPENFTEQDVLNGMHILFADNQLNNIRSTLFEKIKNECDEFISSNSNEPFVTDVLLKCPDDLNKVKRFFYWASNKDDIANNFRTYINESLDNYKPLTKIDNEYFSKKQLDNLVSRFDNFNDVITLEEDSKVSLGNIVDVIQELHDINNKNKVINRSNKSDENTIFINNLINDLEEIISKEDPNHYKLERLKNISQLNTVQSQLKYLRDRIGVSTTTLKNSNTYQDEEPPYEKLYNYLLKGYIDNSNSDWIETTLVEKIRNSYKFSNGNIDVLRFPNFNYDENIIFKPSNKITFFEFDISKPFNYNDKFDPNNIDANITDSWLGLSGTNKALTRLTLSDKLKEIKNTTRVKTLTFSSNVIYNTSNHWIIDEALSNGFNIKVPASGWILNRKTLSREEFISKFTESLDSTQKTKYKDFNTSVLKLKDRLLSLNIDQVDEDGNIEFVTNDLDIINHNISMPLILKPTSKYDLNIINKEHVTKNEFDNFSGLKHLVQKKKNYFKITAKAIEKVTKIEKADISSNSFNKSSLIQNIIRDLDLKVFTFNNDDVKSPKGYIKDGDIYINISNDNSTNSGTFLHELSHLMFAGFKSMHPNEYLTLIDNINTSINGLDDSQSKEDWNRFIKDPKYKNLSKYDQIEEYTVRKLGRQLDYQEDEIELMSDVDMLALITKMFKLDEKINSNDVANNSLGALLASKGSEYNKSFLESFPSSDYLNEVKLAEYKERLIKTGELIENCK